MPSADDLKRSQIFGRAGRPGYETSGEGYICTTQDKLDHYLDAIMAQVRVIGCALASLTECDFSIP